MPIDHLKNIIEVRDLTFSYGDNVILQDINLNVHVGDYLGIIGPNGGGKTTLIKLILGLLKPLKGQVILFGQPLSQFKNWEKIGYVAQKATSFDQKFPITVREVVSLGRAKAVDWALDQVDMTEFSERLIGELSGGQQQRVFIARALAQKPEVIFLDEPTSGVDSKSQEQFYKLLEKLNHKLDITLVLISHDLSLVMNEVTEIAIVNCNLEYRKNA